MNRKKTSRPLYYQLSLVLVFCLVSIATMSQVKISGKVTSSDGKPLPYISVVVKNTSFGSSTDLDGNYSFTADLKAGQYVLEFTGVGLKSKEEALQVGNETSYSVNTQLAEDALNLDEVIITGTNVRTSKKQLGNSISTINAKQLENTGTSNLTAILNGRVMGAQVTQNSGDPAGGIS